MVFRVSSSSKRSALVTCLMALIMAGVGGGSSGSGSSEPATAAGTGAAARSTVGGGLGLFLLPGGLPLARFFGSGAATGSAAGGASSLTAAAPEPLQQSLQLSAAQAALPLR